MKKKMKLKEDIDVRQATNKLLELVDNGIIDPNVALVAALKYMSEEEVSDMCRINEFFLDTDSEYDESLLREAFEAGYKAARKLN